MSSKAASNERSMPNWRSRVIGSEQSSQQRVISRMNDDRIAVDLLDEEGIDRMLEEGLALLYKHSSACSISHLAHQEVLNFSRQHPDVPVYQLDVIAERPLSQNLADRLQVPHQSPQVILLRNGKAVWHASHFKIRAVNIERETGSSGNTPSAVSEG